MFYCRVKKRVISVEVKISRQNDPTAIDSRFFFSIPSPVLLNLLF